MCAVFNIQPNAGIRVDGISASEKRSHHRRCEGSLPSLAGGHRRRAFARRLRPAGAVPARADRHLSSVGCRRLRPVATLRGGSGRRGARPAPADGSGQRHRRTGALRRHRHGAVRQGQAAALDVGRCSTGARWARISIWARSSGASWPGASSAAAAGTSRPSTRSGSPSATTWRWETEWSCTGTCCSTTGGGIRLGGRRLGFRLLEHLQPQPRCRELPRDHETG